MRKKGSAERTGRERTWQANALIALLILAVLVAGYYGVRALMDYLNFLAMRKAVQVDTYYAGITIDGQDVSGMTREEVLARWRASERDAAQAMTLAFTLDEERWVLRAEDLGYFSDYEQVLEQAYQLGRGGTLEARYQVVVQTAERGAAFAVNRGYDPERLMERIQEIAGQLSALPVDAQVSGFSLKSKEFSFTDDRQGRAVDEKALYEAASRQLNSGAGGILPIALTVLEPRVTLNQLAQRYGLIASATTSASTSTDSRLNNIRLALKAINGLRIEPGETFSFNRATGERTTAKGYQPAGAINNGVMIQEPGGGVCQVSTTLFNAAAKAGMVIKKRSPHSRVVGYVQAGKDAMVDWPHMDLAFDNSTEGPVYLTASLDAEKKVSVSVYGPKLKGGARITITSEKTGATTAGPDRFIPDSALPTGATELVESAREGLTTVTHRNYLDRDGKTTKREILFYSIYPAAGNLYRIGP